MARNYEDLPERELAIAEMYYGLCELMAGDETPFEIANAFMRDVPTILDIERHWADKCLDPETYNRFPYKRFRDQALRNAIGYLSDEAREAADAMTKLADCLTETNICLRESEGTQ